MFDTVRWKTANMVSCRKQMKRIGISSQVEYIPHGSRVSQPGY